VGSAPRFPLTKTTSTAAYLTFISASHLKYGNTRTYAAVAAKTSDLFAVVNNPMLAANSSINTPTMISFVVGFLMWYKARIAIKRRTTVMSMLTIVTNRLTLRSGMYPMLSSRLSDF
jgi:hypothetical protein